MNELETETKTGSVEAREAIYALSKLDARIGQDRIAQFTHYYAYEKAGDTLLTHNPDECPTCENLSLLFTYLDQTQDLAIELETERAKNQQLLSLLENTASGKED